MLKKRPRLPTQLVAPHMKHSEFNPRRCYKTGAVEKLQTPWPPPWLNAHRDFNQPKKYPLEIDHLNWKEFDNSPNNLRFISRFAHIERGESDPTRRRKIKRGGRW